MPPLALSSNDPATYLKGCIPVPRLWSGNTLAYILQLGPFWIS
jgi:hypothetical protein